MKDIDISKAREAILLLQSYGARDCAQVMWDLLDHYVSQKPSPLIFQPSEAQAGNGLSESPHSPVVDCDPVSDTEKGSSVQLSTCDIHQLSSETPYCTQPAVGFLTSTTRGFHLCRFHSKHPKAYGHHFTPYTG